MIKPGSHLKYLTDPERRDLFSAYQSGTNKQNTMNALFLLLSDKEYRETGLILAKRYFYNWKTVDQLEDCVNQSILKFVLKHSESKKKSLTNLDHLNGSFFCTVIGNAINEGRKYNRQADILTQQTPGPIIQDRWYFQPEAATIIKQHQSFLKGLLGNVSQSFCSGKGLECKCVIYKYVQALLEGRTKIPHSYLSDECPPATPGNAGKWRNGFREIVRKEFNQYRKTP